MDAQDHDMSFPAQEKRNESTTKDSSKFVTEKDVVVGQDGKSLDLFNPNKSVTESIRSEAIEKEQKMKLSAL